MTRTSIPARPTARRNRATAVALAALAPLVLVTASAGSPASAATQTAGPPSTSVVSWGEAAMPGLSSPAEGIADIATAFGATLVLGTDGRIRADLLEAGRIGYVPPGLSDVTHIALSDGMAVALHRDGTVTAWNPYGWDAAQPPAGLDDVTAVAASSGSALALRSDGSLVAWGDQAPMNSVPPGLDHVVAIDAANAHDLALRADGTVLAWGLNYAGQMDVPAGLDDVVAISAGEYHNLALRADGTVVAWGTYAYGQPAVAPRLADVVAIDAGVHHDLAVLGDGTVVAWKTDGTVIPGLEGATDVPPGLARVTRVVAAQGASYAFVSDADTTAPVMSEMPAVTVLATAPGGAPVSYVLPTATDETDGDVPVLCEPASGTTFAIGSTDVTCEASDASGNTVTGAFAVVVCGADQQLGDLLSAVAGVGPGDSLAAKVQAALAAHGQRQETRAVATLQAFVQQVQAQQGKSIATDVATRLVTDARRIQAVLGG